ncbi:enoyl-CoA hydratase-related protein [Vibrio mediterranei]|uniref:enoyl-CoA hydratase-related protein n=1 Tax=Vibrio mediterranei TaxID=689 RepID=UPI0022846E54|nr:enoyl-CoA hydratase-related protein [Vibrio mediterranei]MCY9855361.1 enoyl-CoA hydratase-related protein [Vibrio mediterranei]
MTELNAIQFTVDTKGVAHLTLDRQHKSNAFDDAMVADLLYALYRVGNDKNIRCLVLRGNGKHFSAGADLAWMKSMANKSQNENLEDAQKLAELMKRLDTLTIPTVAVVQGSAFGGALGLLCCCDVVVAHADCRFCLSEVKLGLVPATIGPYVIRTIGARYARRYMLSAEVMGAPQALELGIVHEVLLGSKIDPFVDALVDKFVANSPNAIANTKALIQHCHNHPIDPQLIDFTSQVIAEARTSSQGQKGLQAFFDKVPPIWKEEE